KPDEEYVVHLVQPDISTSIEPNYDIKLDIIYEDEDIIVLSKQSGLTVHPGAGTNNDTLLNAVIAHLDVRLGIVHRLDKDTSGLMVIAKNEEAHSFLSELLSNRKVKREYLAVVWGTLSSQQGTIETNIAPKRGRTHQIRVHMSHIGHSIVGDQVYGKNIYPFPYYEKLQAIYVVVYVFLHFLYE
ncbi:uncharacterized RNA pseudouridine synthase Cpar_0723-like, partial [Phlebotomus papatasi]|uniref:uncharacterized RNA pseudouridine synthase Cpar_0723-like n=1 Tax=Phlebotomus papatasi TaxID=29031 RepID=UPI00248403B8